MFDSLVIMKKGRYRPLKEQVSKFRQHLNIEEVQGGSSKSGELYEVEQHPQEKKL